ncbi:MAG: hypothetical protein AUREO_006970 [Aureobasidium pullulans]|nr:MAG: hypothetical protein AUREO_006970 [Aureobasidium pullulans]
MLFTLLHGETTIQRLSGSLIDVGVDFPKESGVSSAMAKKALDYIRTQDPSFDENEAGAIWAESEIMRVEEEYMARAEKLGIYKRTDTEQAPDTQSSASTSDIYGESALDKLRKANKARWMEEDRKKEEAKKQQEAERMSPERSSVHLTRLHLHNPPRKHGWSLWSVSRG